MDSATLFDVSGKTVVVTGGSRGIGLMIAHGFVANGARVLITSRKAEAVDAAVEWLNEQGASSGASAAGFAADVATDAGMDAVAEWVEDVVGEQPVDVLVNNAGTNWAESFDTYPTAAFDKVLRLNVTAAFGLTQRLKTALTRGKGGGVVINIGSINGEAAPTMDTFAYSASKAAIHHLTRHMAAKLAGENIRVNAVAPGPFRSKMMEATLDAFEDAIVSSVPLGRIGEPSDMAGVCLFLSSQAGAWVTGAVVPVDGGVLVGSSAL